MALSSAPPKKILEVLQVDLLACMIVQIKVQERILSVEHEVLSTIRVVCTIQNMRYTNHYSAQTSGDFLVVICEKITKPANSGGPVSYALTVGIFNMFPISDMSTPTSVSISNSTLVTAPEVVGRVSGVCRWTYPNRFSTMRFLSSQKRQVYKLLSDHLQAHVPCRPPC